MREHVLERQRLEVQAVGGVVVGGDGLGVAVDHHRVATGRPDRHRRVHAAVVELDPLADAVGPGPEDDHRRPVAAAYLVACRSAALPARVEVRRGRRELRRARVDRAVHALPAEGLLGIERQRLQLAQEPRVDRGALVHLRRRRAAAEGLLQDVVAIPRRDLQPGQQVVLGGDDRGIELARAHRLGERLLERAADGHRLAHRLHVRREALVGARELLEREPRPLHDDVVDGGLERRRGELGDVVVDLLERVAHRELRRDLGDREPCRLRRQRAGARDARVHLDDDDLLGRRVHRELHVGAAGLHADGPDDGDRLVAELLVEPVGQRLLRRDGDRVARVHAHRIDVLDRADDDHVVVAVAHDLELELAPAEHRLVEQHLRDRRGLEPLRDDAAELLGRARDAAAAAAQRVGRAHDDRQAEVDERVLRLGHGLRDRTARHPQARPLHRLAEQVAVLRPGDRVGLRADELDAVALERPVVVQVHRDVQRGLPAERRQQRVGALLLDDLRDDVRAQRLHVGRVGELRVGHDRRRVGVDEHDLVALLAQHLAGLHAGVVELGRLADDDRAGAQEHDPAEVVTPRHGWPPGSDRRGTGSRWGRGRPPGGTARCRRRRPAG